MIEQTWQLSLAKILGDKLPNDASKAMEFKPSDNMIMATLAIFAAPAGGRTTRWCTEGNTGPLGTIEGCECDR